MTITALEEEEAILPAYVIYEISWEYIIDGYKRVGYNIGKPVAVYTNLQRANEVCDCLNRARQTTNARSNNPMRLYHWNEDTEGPLIMNFFEIVELIGEELW